MFLEAHMCKKLSFILVLMSAVFMFSGCGNNNSSCTTTHSYGVSSFTKDVGKTCFKKLSEDRCYKGDGVFPEVIEKAVSDLQKYEFVFYKDSCTDKDGTPLECPDFIPETLKMTKLAGCETYTVDPHTDCDVGCPKIFFSTDNDYFKTIAEEGLEFYKNGSLIGTHKYFISDSGDGKVHFYGEVDKKYGEYYAHGTSFSWSETAEDGTETRNKVFVIADFVDPDAVEEEPVPDNDDLEIPEE